jgi:hypothetical protein
VRMHDGQVDITAVVTRLIADQFRNLGPLHGL